MKQEFFLKKIKLEPQDETIVQKPYVWLTDDARTLKKLLQDGECAVYLLTPQNKDLFCPEAQWCLETDDPWSMAADKKQEGNAKTAEWMDYLWKVWQRKHDLPWKICETNRLFLREMTEQDLEYLYEWQKDPQTARYVAGPSPDREDEVKKFYAYRKLIYGFYGFGLWMVCEKESKRPVGRAGLQIRDGFAVPEIGFEIDVSHRGKGYAREALEAVIQYSKEELELEEVRSVVDSTNLVSQKLCESLGFSVEERKIEGKTDWIFYRKQL